MVRLTAIFLLLVISMSTLGQTGSGRRTRRELPAGYWSLEKSQPIIDKTQTIRLAPDLSHLTPGERTAVAKLLEVGKIFQRLYEKQRHPEATRSHAELVQLDKRLGSPATTQNLLTLYRLNQGPIATTLDNKREPFLPVEPVEPGKNVYPWGVKKEEIDAFLTANPNKRDEILHLRSVVRRNTKQNLADDVARLTSNPALDFLHSGLREDLQVLAGLKRSAKPRPSSPQTFYAVPYSVTYSYADELVKAYQLLNEAADAVQGDDEEFAKYLRNRARDLMTDDYESGDAAWVTGRFKNLNAEIGSYETYDDELFGVKTFFAVSILATRQQETAALRQALKGLQAIEDSLPYENHKKIREDIPVGVYDVVADFGQSRGGNTATILPNESYLARRYGRTILLRTNIMRDQNIFQGTSGNLQAAIGAEQAKELTNEGNFYRTLWHEIGHYLGVDRTKDNRDLDEALLDNASAMEEMKADLVSLYAVPALRKQGYYTDAQARSVYAGGILRVLQNNKPRRDQPYNTMQLMQWNFFLENGLLTFDRSTGRMRVHYDKYHDSVKKLLTKVLDVQYQGDKTASDRFIEQYTTWDETLHGVIAKNIRDQQKYRFRLFKYAALGE
ncbi:MAG TPA: zincin-like metallopeptidase domain-containing protein [Pyrinomonadaceae bacterium]|nr:zincin-like metallopeptidase domain-containing protein [Pyrinomonadaceae bacterium]